MLARFRVVIKIVGPENAPIIHSNSMSPCPSPSFPVTVLNIFAVDHGIKKPIIAPVVLAVKSVGKKLSLEKSNQKGASQILQILGIVISNKSEIVQAIKLDMNINISKKLGTI